MDTRAELRALFEVDPNANADVDFDAVVNERIAALGLEPPRPVDDDSEEEPSEDARELLWWLLRMAASTYRHVGLAHASAHSPALEARFAALVADRPEADEEHAQMLIDAASSLRRASAIRARVGEGPIVAVGDDDATVLALALLGATELYAADVDPAVLAFLVAAAKSVGVTLDARRADVFEDAPPDDWRERCAAAVTDPIRSRDACLAFLTYARVCVRPGGLVFLADHPDWNLELPEVLAACASMGLVLEAEEPLLHAYPIDATWVPDPEGKVRELAVLGVTIDAAWLRRLLAVTRGCTNLYVLRVA